MNLKTILAKPLAAYFAKSIEEWKKNPHSVQQNLFEKLIKTGKQTQFGKNFHFNSISTYEDFKSAIPLNDYEGFQPYIDKIIEGEVDVLWKGRPLYFAQTSGTVSGNKLLPVSKDGISFLSNSGRIAMLNYFHQIGNTDLLKGSGIFIQGNPKLKKVGGIPTGRMSGITYHHMPFLFRKMTMPTYKTNSILDWEEKMSKIAEETLQKNMTIIGGIPPWLIMYFERLLEQTGKQTIKEIFPNFNLLIYGGVNYAPYHDLFMQMIGDENIGRLEVYAASEGFIAFDDSPDEEGMLLNMKAGIFYEFVPPEELYQPNPTCLRLHDVKLDVNYAIILTTNSGLWRYIIGDTVRFVSLEPYRLVVSGRTKHFISTYGEHVIGEEVDNVLSIVSNEEGVEIVEFTVAPKLPGSKSGSYQEWFVEFKTPPKDLSLFSKKLDNELCQNNYMYKSLRDANILLELKVIPVPINGFRKYMKSKGKLGGQNKLARLSNDRTIANELLGFL